MNQHPRKRQTLVGKDLLSSYIDTKESSHKPPRHHHLDEEKKNLPHNTQNKLAYVQLHCVKENNSNLLLNDEIYRIEFRSSDEKKKKQTTRQKKKESYFESGMRQAECATRADE